MPRKVHEHYWVLGACECLSIVLITPNSILPIRHEQIYRAPTGIYPVTPLEAFIY